MGVLEGDQELTYSQGHQVIVHISGLYSAIQTCPKALLCAGTGLSGAATGYRTSSVPVRMGVRPGRQGTRGSEGLQRGVMKDQGLQGLHGEASLERVFLSEEKWGRAVKEGTQCEQRHRRLPRSPLRELGGEEWGRGKREKIPVADRWWGACHLGFQASPMQVRGQAQSDVEMA